MQPLSTRRPSPTRTRHIGLLSTGPRLRPERRCRHGGGPAVEDPPWVHAGSPRGFSPELAAGYIWMHLSLSFVTPTMGGRYQPPLTSGEVASWALQPDALPFKQSGTRTRSTQRVNRTRSDCRDMNPGPLDPQCANRCGVPWSLVALRLLTESLPPPLSAHPRFVTFDLSSPSGIAPPWSGGFAGLLHGVFDALDAAPPNEGRHFVQTRQSVRGVG